MRCAERARGGWLLALCLGLCIWTAGAGTAFGDIPLPESRRWNALAVSGQPPTALWVVRDALTDLLVQVRGRGDAYYVSHIEPTAPLLAAAWKRHGTYDPLAVIIDLAHRRGMRVHAWLNVYLVKGKADAPPGHVTLVHPDWVAEDPRGVSMSHIKFETLVAAGNEGVHLTPGNLEVMRHFVSVVDEILSRYHVDGIHLDYCRYPKWDVGYEAPMRAGFLRKTGVDPVDLVTDRGPTVAGKSGAELLTLRRQWIRFKADQVTALVKAVREDCRTRRPGVALSVAVKPDADAAYAGYGQDWVRWVREDLVDFVTPMMYSPSAQTVERQAQAMTTRVPPERVWAGVSVYNQSLKSAASKIRNLRAAGFGGISIFSYNSLPPGGSALMRLNEAR
jgi:uncharacterized lipoprotein YddW (UPF0748 family)